MSTDSPLRRIAGLTVFVLILGCRIGFADDTLSTQSAAGRGTIETYTVVYERDAGPVRGVVVGRTDAGRRFVANTPADRQLLEDFVAVENVGRSGTLRHADGVNVFDPA